MAHQHHTRQLRAAAPVNAGGAAGQHRLQGLETEGSGGEYLGARSIKFYPHPGAHLVKKPGRWIVAAELVETTRLFGRGIAAIEPQWLEQVAGIC
jgi:HrpA-like RNA helicase